MTGPRRGVIQNSSRRDPIARKAPACIAMLIALAPASGCVVLEDLGYQSNPNSESLLTLFQRPPPAQAVRWALDPHSADNRYRGISLLANAPFGGEDVYLDLFTDSARDPDSAVRAASVRGLAHHGRPEHADEIARALSDESSLVRLEAARAAQRIHNPSIVPALFGRLDAETEDEHDVRAAVAHALGQYPQRRVLDRLVGALRDPSLTVNRHAAEALTILTGQDLGIDPVAWLSFVTDAEAPFAEGSRYRYQVFQRDMRLVEYIPLYPEPPSDPAAEPVGLPRVEQ